MVNAINSSAFMPEQIKLQDLLLHLMLHADRRIFTDHRCHNSECVASVMWGHYRGMTQKRVINPLDPIKRGTTVSDRPSNCPHYCMCKKNCFRNAENIVMIECDGKVITEIE